ncbi:MAG: BC1881 family protein [Bacilli bacterium]|jgi:hypothetical protein
MAPPNYRLGRCCANCSEGHGSGINAGWYCSWHGGRPVARECVCDDWTPEIRVLPIDRPPQTLATVPTCDLVKELAAREGVTEFVAGVQDRYHVKVRTVDAITTADFDLGPATILVVVD